MPRSRIRSSIIRVVRGRPVLAASVVAGIGVFLLVAGATAGAGAVLGSNLLASSTGSAPSATPTASAPPVDTTGFPTGVGIFTDHCSRTQTKADDPILMPGMDGQSMHHDFFGNRSVNASTKPSELLGGSTSCSTSADASAYWTPVMYQNGTALAPQSALIYWRAPTATAASTKTIPAGLTMIAGNEKAMSPQGVQFVRWMCSGQTSRGSASPQDCPAGQQLRLVITFPNCWDGHTLDGQAQKNVVYPTKPNGACPASHPVQIPQIVFHANYPTSSAAGLTLSMGPTQTGPVTTEHADFMDGWNQAVFAADVNACVVPDIRCGPVMGPEATPLGGRAPGKGRATTPGRHDRSPRPGSSSGTGSGANT